MMICCKTAYLYKINYQVENIDFLWVASSSWLSALHGSNINESGRGYNGHTYFRASSRTMRMGFENEKPSSQIFVWPNMAWLFLYDLWGHS